MASDKTICKAQSELNWSRILIVNLLKKETRIDILDTNRSFKECSARNKEISLIGLATKSSSTHILNIMVVFLKLWLPYFLESMHYDIDMNEDYENTNELDNSEEEGIEDYKEGGYHPVFIG